jgi:hypothetical protein
VPYALKILVHSLITVRRKCPQDMTPQLTIEIRYLSTSIIAPALDERASHASITLQAFEYPVEALP